MDANIKHKASNRFNLVEKSVCELTELRVGRYVFASVERRALVFPFSGVLRLVVDFPFEQLAFSLIKPGREAPDLLNGNNDACKPKYRMIVVSFVASRDEGSYVPKFVQIGDQSHVLLACPIKDTKARAERGPRN
jgi:hypothetical protein